MTYYLAVDIGASSGRHILGHVEDGKIALEEVYRFENGMTEVDGTLTWDVDALTGEVVAGIKKCGELGKVPSYIAIDTWGVDYVLLDDADRPLLPAVAYRDASNAAAAEQVEAIIPFESLYARTGIQRQTFNTVFQLYRDKQSGKLQKAKRLLFIPDYLTWRLTGVQHNEYTIASTSGLLDAASGDWDRELFGLLGYPTEIVGPLFMPGSVAGPLSPELEQAVGFPALVLHAASHDTASAVAACPIDENSVYVSSGTWSLIGTENAAPVTSKEALRWNFTNEGGVEKRYRFLDNIMGMWLFQRIRKDLDKKYTYDQMMDMAKASSFTGTFDCTSPALLAPENMIEAVRSLLGQPDLPLPDVLSAVYHSLAHAYDTVIRRMEQLSGKRVDSILIVGGGSKDRYLNALTSKVTGKKVLTGLGEATALGNLLTQVMHDKGVDLTAARKIVSASFPIREIEI